HRCRGADHRTSQRRPRARAAGRGARGLPRHARRPRPRRPPRRRTPMSTRVTRDDALRRFRLVGLWLPLAILALAVAVQVAFMPSLPATIATHWNAAGEPDGFSATWSFPLVTFLIGAGT